MDRKRKSSTAAAQVATHLPTEKRKIKKDKLIYLASTC